MSIIEPYRIIGTEIANLEIGSINNPKFFKITAGQRQKNSLLYHCKIGQNYYVYKIFSQTDLFDPENLVHYALRFANYDNSNLPQFGVLNLTEL